VVRPRLDIGPQAVEERTGFDPFQTQDHWMRKKGPTSMISQIAQETLEAHVDFFTAHAEQIRLWLPLWRLLAKGKPVSQEQLASSSHRPLEEIQAELPSLDVRLDQEGHVLASGLSLLPTVRQFHLGEQALYTWCALDTLAFAPLLGRTARVISSCPVTGKEIRLTVTTDAIADLSPAGTVVSIHVPGEATSLCHVQQDLCNDGLFFVSHDVAAAWPHLHPKAVLLSVEEAAEVGRPYPSSGAHMEGEPA
jgi:alkylmercury lyase